LSVLQYLVSAPQPTLSDMALVCADPAMSLYCEQMRAALRLDGPGPAFLSIIPVLILLVMAEGLRRGRRFAWWSTVVVNVGLIALGWLMVPSYIHTRLGRRRRTALGAGSRHRAATDAPSDIRR
jgi:hypothetical protein